MRYFDEDDAKELNAQQWQLDLLKLNPAYLGWGPHEDYMGKKGDSWDCRVLLDRWADFGDWELNDLNECVNFYFSVVRESETCLTCGGNGYHPNAQKVVNSFYAHMNSEGEEWCDKITQDELDELTARGRNSDGATLEVVNARNKPKSRGIDMHDGLNRLILIGARLKRLGIEHNCPSCHGNGRVFTAPSAHVSLTLWMLHPRKGCSRGVEIALIEQRDLPGVFAFLRAAAERNAQRFAAIPAA